MAPEAAEAAGGAGVSGRVLPNGIEADAEPVVGALVGLGDPLSASPAATTASAVADAGTGSPTSPLLSTALIGLLFFVFGFVTWLNGPLITFVKFAFVLDDVSAFLVPMAFYLSYLIVSLPASALLRRIGMKRGMAVGLAVMSAGAIVFGQFATMRVFPAALTGLFVIGAGLSILQTAANPYISILGPIESAARRIAFMGICNKVAGILAPIVLGFVVLRGVGDLGTQIHAATTAGAREAILDRFSAGIFRPYMAMAAVLAVVALLVLRSPLPEIQSNTTDRQAGAGGRSIRSYPHLWLGVLCLFVYVGAEVMAGDAIGAYGQAFGLPLERTAFLTSFTLAAMLAGYLAGLAIVPGLVSQERYLAFSAALGVVFVAGAWATRGYPSVAFVAALGFANAMMWPAIFPLAIRGLGRHFEVGSAMMIMAISGGAVLPQMFAVLKQHLPFQLVFAMLLGPAYAYILFYALVGHRIGFSAEDHDSTITPRSQAVG